MKKKLENISVVCCQFKLLRENCHWNIEYDLIECHKHSMKKVIFYLNYGNNIGVKTEREKFEGILEGNFGWYLFPKYTEYKTNAKWFEYNNVVEFILKRKTDESSAD